MNKKPAEPEGLTGIMKMFRMHLEGGKPATGETGVASCSMRTGAMVATYRGGFDLGNEFADHVVICISSVPRC